jgi:glycosyltransferase involved in cell wall biosynthesis
MLKETNNAKNKKVAFLMEIPTPYRDSLFERLCRNQDLNFEVLYCASSEYGRGWKQEHKNYPYKVLPGFRCPIVGRHIFVLKINLGIWHRLLKGNYGAVIISGYIQPTMQLAILWCLWHKVPYILWSESHNLTPRSILKRLIKRPLVRFTVKRAAALFVMGSNSSDYFISYGADPSDIFLFPNAPDVKRLAEESSNYGNDIENLREELGIQGSPVIIYTGRLVGFKDVETLLRAFQLVQQEMPQAGLVIVGDGYLRSSLEDLARGLKLNNIFFSGFIQPKDLVKYYACADIFVLPSYDEPWGVAVHEAMACGLPVVVSDKAGCAKDLVWPGQSGFIFCAKDIKGLASAIAKLLGDRDLCEQMGRYAQEIAMKWDYSFLILQLKQALRLIE